MGMPCLSFSVHYNLGHEVAPQIISEPKVASLRAAGDDGHEWERDTDLIYTVQSGPLRHLSLRWRNAVSRATFTDDADENRLIVSYQVKF
ncbi:outer membrane porin, OprD family [Pseudomonas sp. SWI36]|nr:outer membrane porin, OprD family [Pseudomonas sp. SWI36]